MNSMTTMIFATLIGGVGAAPAVAQGLAEGEITEQLLVCDDVIDLTERLTCFNAIVDNLKAALVVPVADSPSTSVSATEAPDVAPAASPEIDDFGSEGIVSRSAQEEESSAVDNIEATIVRSWRNHDGRFSVELDNGQIWRETQGTRVGQPKVETSVKISRGRFGGYRMKFEHIKRVAWVRRTK